MPFDAAPITQTTSAPRDLWAIARMLVCDLFNLFGDSAGIARQLTVTRDARALMLTWLRACETVLRHLLLIEAAALMASLPPAPRARARRKRVRRVVIHDPAAPETWRVCFRAGAGGARSAQRTGRTYYVCARTPTDPDADYFIDPHAAAEARAAKAAWLADMNTSFSRAREVGPESDLAIAARTPSDRRAAGALANESRFHSPWPLAERAEALLRVFNAPALYARRLAFRLRRAPGDADLMMRVPADIERAADRETTTHLHNVTLARWRSRDTS